MSPRTSSPLLLSNQVRSPFLLPISLLSSSSYDILLTSTRHIQLVRYYSRKPSASRKGAKLAGSVGVTDESQVAEKLNVVDKSNEAQDTLEILVDGSVEAKENSVTSGEASGSQSTSIAVESSSSASSLESPQKELSDEVKSESSSLEEEAKGNAEVSAPPASSASTTNGAPQKQRQRLRVSTKPNSSTSKEGEEAGDVLGEETRPIVGLDRLFEVDAPIPPTSLLLVTPNIHSLLNIPTHLSIDMATADHIAHLKSLAKNQSGIALIYSHQIATPSSASGTGIPSQPASYFGMLCSITSVAKHKTLPRCELTLLPLHRIRTKPGFIPKSFAVGDIEKWGYDPIDPADVDDLIVAAFPLLPTPITRPVRPSRANPMVLEMMLHRICASILEGVGRHDPAGVRQVLERAFVERNFHVKFEAIQRALGITTVSHELSHSIEDMTEKRKLLGVEQQMEKLVRQQLADPNHDPEMKLSMQIAALPERLKPAANKEFDYMKSLDPSGQEHGVISTYLDWLVNFPWEKTTEDRFDMAEAKRILDRSHHGLDDVKVKILQLMANASRTGRMSAKPLLFVGPPRTCSGASSTFIISSFVTSKVNCFGSYGTSGAANNAASWLSLLTARTANCRMMRCICLRI